jgi:hypothetical protein
MPALPKQQAFDYLAATDGTALRLAARSAGRQVPLDSTVTCASSMRTSYM